MYVKLFFLVSNNLYYRLNMANKIFDLAQDIIFRSCFFNKYLMLFTIFLCHNSFVFVNHP